MISHVLILASQSAREFLTSMKAKADELALMDTPLSDDDLTLYIINGLGPAYRDLAAAVRVRDTSISFKDLHDKVISQEIYLKNQESAQSSLFATANAVQSSHPNNSPHPYYNNNNHGGSRGSNNRGRGGRGGGCSRGCGYNNNYNGLNYGGYNNGYFVPPGGQYYRPPVICQHCENQDMLLRSVDA